MELNIIDNSTVEDISHSFGISFERAEELQDLLETIVSNTISSGNSFELAAQYKKVAFYCNNIEEYTYCLHVFIFFLARNGKLNTEPSVKN